MVSKYNPSQRVRVQVIDPVTKESKSLTFYSITVNEAIAVIEASMEEL